MTQITPQPIQPLPGDFKYRILPDSSHLKGLYDNRPIPQPVSRQGFGSTGPSFLFRASAIWWFIPGLRKIRELKESTHPQPAGESTDRIELESRPASLESQVEIQSLDNQIRFYLWEEEEAEMFGADPYLTLDYVPEEVEVVPSSLMKSLNVVGLNYPRYHYGGGEDIINFTIQWYGHRTDRDSVIAKCRRLEALTKSNGWANGPPEIFIRWGDANILFGDHVFSVEKAPYRISNFQLNKTVPQDSNPHGFEPFGLLPIIAEQKVTLKRIAGQLTWEDISYPSFQDSQTDGNIIV